MKNLFLHQFFKDLRQTWILWALWFAFTISQFAMAAWNVGSSNIIGQSSYSQMLSMIPMIHGLILFVLIPALILQEPTVGVSAFWLTRPIPRGTVLGSKLLALMILVLIPTLGQCTVLLAHGVVPWDVFLGGVQIALHELSWIAFILMLATLSPNFTRYLIAAVVLYALQFAADWIYTFAITLKIAHKTGNFFFITPGLNNSRMVASDTLRILLSLGVVFFQYQTRRTKLAISLAVVSVLISFFSAKLWPWDFLTHPESPAPTISSKASKIDLRLDQSVFVQDNQDFAGGKTTKRFAATFNCQNGDVTRAVDIMPVSAEITFADGRALKSLPLRLTGMPVSIGQYSTIMRQSLDSALGYLPMVNCLQNGMIWSSQQIFIMSKEDFDKYDGQSGKLTVHVQVQLSDYHVISEWPLNRGEAVSKGSEKTSVTDILLQKSGVKVDLQTRKVDLQLRPQALRLGVDPSNFFVVVSTKMGEALATSPTQQFGNYMSFFMNNPIFSQMLSGVGVGGNGIEKYETKSLNFGPRENTFPSMELPIDVTDEWLSGAKLFELRKDPTGQFETIVTVDDFKISNQYNNRFEESQIQDAPLALKGVKLPEKPSRSDVWKYILQIVGTERRSYNSHDPEVDLLTKVGPSNADELFMALFNGNNIALLMAINNMDLSGTPYKDLVLRYLPQQEMLIDSVTKNHWEADAKGILLEKVTDFNRTGNFIQDNWVKALASVRDPLSYPALLNYTKTRIERGQGNPIESIRVIPGRLISSMVGQIWKDSRGKKNEADMIQLAASWGISDTLKRASEILAAPSNRSKDQQTLKSRARDVFRNYTASPDHLLDTELTAWYAANASQLQFDPQLGRFLVHAKPAQNQDAPWPGAEKYMSSLGERAAKGDTNAVDEIVDNMARLTEGLDPVKDSQRITDLNKPVWSAFNVLRVSLDKDPSIVHILEYANTKDHLNVGFVPSTYSLAAANGNEAALGALIHYQDHNWSLLDVANNLGGAVANNNQEAVDFILNVYNDPATASLPNYKQLKEVLINQIKNAANAGNEKAKTLYQLIQTTK